MSIELEQIGIIHSPFKEKFGTPRQPGLITDTISSIELLPPYDREESLEGIEQFSHLWVTFIFHQVKQKLWTPKVRPPRLGGNKSIGVFASRSPYRPNPLGLSAVELHGTRKENNKLFIDIKGADLIDGTPIVDIKPYIPYTDCISCAKAGYAEQAPGHTLQVEFSELAMQQLARFEEQYPQLESFIRQVIALDPRPAYTAEQESDKQYGVKLLEFDVQWQVIEGIATVLSLQNE